MKEKLGGLGIACLLIACTQTPTSDPNPSDDIGTPDSSCIQGYDCEGGVHSPPSGLCCQIQDNFVDSSVWNNGRYDCPSDDAGLDPSNPGWVCNVNSIGQCGNGTGFACYSCDQQQCIVGMNCLAINGTGTVLPCNQGYGD